MTRPVVGAFFVLAAAVLVGLFPPLRGLLFWLPGLALLVVLLAVRRRLGRDAGPASAEPASDDRAESLRRWLARTDTLIHWSECSRTDWDRHLRPMLARQFEMAAHQRKAKDPAAFHATGQMHFGPELWEWVAPDNVARSGGSQPGPGRDALNDILQRLEQV